MKSKEYNGKTFEINERGFWESDDNSGHVYDDNLCNGLIKLLERYHIKQLLDLGCGTGEYVKKITSYGYDCEAYDGNPNTEILTSGIGKVLDFSFTFNLNKKFDCVLSLEVGEHIPKIYEEIFIENICNHSNNLIIISWAIIGQGGDGHVNCQNNDYIIEQLNSKGFQFNFNDSVFLREKSSATWFKDTIMVFNKI